MSARLLCLLLLLPAADADDGPPLVRRPPHFNGAVGTFDIAARAEPTTLQAEDPLTYTVRVTATGTVGEPPARPRLEDFLSFKEAFYIEPLGPPEGARPDERSWEFAYRLKPKSTEVTAVPGFPFVFFRPGAVPAWRGYQTKYAPEIPLQVRPREAVKIGTEEAKPFDVPEATFVLVTGPNVLRHDRIERLPGLAVLAALFLVPPVACVAWYLAWRRLSPDAARLAHQRRSRAARDALAALKQLRAPTAEERARQAALIVARYLHQRWELPQELPTPTEAADHLRRAGLPEASANEASAFFAACDTARFAPGQAETSDLRPSAEKVIVTLEELTCPLSS